MIRLAHRHGDKDAAVVAYTYLERSELWESIGALSFEISPEHHEQAFHYFGYFWLAATSSCRTAHTAIWDLELTPSLFRMCWIWVSAVRLEMNSFTAI